MENRTLHDEDYVEPLPAYSETDTSTVSNATWELKEKSQSSAVATTAPTDQHQPILPKPIAIPATTKKLGSPFLRAYPPILAGFDISCELFLEFIDHLNRVTIKSPPLEILGLAGGILGFVPNQTVGLVGLSVQAASNLTARAISNGATELCLRKANAEIFAPCGLKVEIAKLKALAKIAGIPILRSDGKLDKKAPLLEPLQDFDESYDVSGQQRRLQALEQWVEPLELEGLPEVSHSSNPMGSWHTKSSEWQRRRGEKGILKKREKAHEKSIEKQAKAEVKYERKLEKLEERAEKAHEKRAPGDELDKKLAKIEAKKDRAPERHERRLEKIERKEDRKEEKGMRKILWLIIRPVDADSGPGENPDVA